MSNVFAPIADGISRYPLAVAGGVGALLLLGLLSKSGGKSSGGISDAIAGKLIDADVQKAQIAAQQNIATAATMGSVQAAVAQAKASISIAGIQSASDQFATSNSTIQNRERLSVDRELGLKSFDTQKDLANIDSTLKRALQASQIAFDQWRTQIEDQFSRWSLPKILDYQRSQDLIGLKMTRASSPYIGAQNQWLIRKGYGPSYSPSYGIGGSGVTGQDVQGIAGAIAMLGRMAGDYFGGGGGSNTAVANSAMDSFAASSASSYGGLFSSGGGGGFFD